MNGVPREEVAIFLRKLRRERLIMCDDQCRLLYFFDYIRDRERLPGACHAQKRLASDAFFEPLCEFLYRLRLITGGFIC